MPAGGGFAGSSGAAESGQDAIILLEPLEVGQQWKTKDGSTLIIAGRKEKSGRFDILVDGRQQLMGSEALTAMLLADGYTLVAGGTSPVIERGKTIASQETPLASDAEYVRLDHEIEELIDQVEAANTVIGEILEENAAAFGEKYDEFLEQRSTFIQLINSITDEDNSLVDIANASNREITEDMLKKKKANYEEIYALLAELKNLELAVRLKAKSGEGIVEEEPISPTAPVIEDQGTVIEPSAVSAEPVPPVSVAAEHHEPAGTAAGEPALAPKQSPEKSHKKKREQTRDMALFMETAKQLKADQVFEKDGQPLLVIRTLSHEGIGIEYRRTASEKKWRKDIIAPRGIRDFLEYLRSEFGWTLMKETTKVPEKKARKHRRKGRVARAMPPIDKDDAAREDLPSTGDTDDEGARYLARMAAGQTVPENVPVEQPKSVERTYEELEKALPAVRKMQCISVIAEGLAPLVRYTEQQSEVSLSVLVERLGVENIVGNITPSLLKILPERIDWSEEERMAFVTGFARRNINESLK